MSPAPLLPHRRLLAEGLALSRGDRLLLEGVSFAVEPGQILLLKGPNGVGKSTLLLALAGLFRPLAGGVVVEGRGTEDRPGTDLHLLAHRSAVKARLTVSENLRFWRQLLGGDGATLAATLERIGLPHAADLEAGLLSAGQTRRLALGRLLVADRPLWLLDEPTAALDAEGEALVAELIAAQLRRGGLVVASTHHDLPLAANLQSHTLVLG